MQHEMWVRTFTHLAAELPGGDGWTLEFAEGPGGSEPGWKTHQHTRASARFLCSKCGLSWPSNCVVIFFHMKLGRPPPQKNSVKMNIFRQKCQKCREFCDATFMQTDIKMALEILLGEIRVQCYGEKVEAKPCDVNADESKTRPHESELCEACIIGVCPLRHHPEPTSLHPEEAVQPEKPLQIYINIIDTSTGAYPLCPWAPPTTKQSVSQMPPEFFCFCFLALLVSIEVFVLNTIL